MTRCRGGLSGGSAAASRGVVDFIADAGSPDYAAGFTESIVAFCEGLADFPHRGLAREDLRPGLRTIGYRKRVVIAYAVLDETVAIIGIFYGGRDHERILRSTEQPGPQAVAWAWVLQVLQVGSSRVLGVNTGVNKRGDRMQPIAVFENRAPPRCSASSRRIDGSAPQAPRDRMPGGCASSATVVHRERIGRPRQT